MTIIVLFGAPGSGKGTQGGLIAQKYGYLHVSTGSMLRDEADKETELGKVINSYISEGELVPDDMICEILSIELDDNKDEKGIILDGFPRTVMQADFLDNLLEKKGLKVNLMIDFKANEKTLIQRLLNRGTISHRTDDTIDTILKRLEIYNTQTTPIIDYYKSTKRYNAIESTTIDETFEEVSKLIDKIQK